MKAAWSWMAGAEGGRRPLVALALLCLGAALWQFPSPFDGNGDAAWLLIAAGRYLDGATLYVDVLETNPPMSVLLYVPAVWAARLLAIAPEWTMYASVLALAALVLSILARLSPYLGFADDRGRAAFVAVAAFVLLVMPSRCFAQREHFAVLGMLPWLALAAARNGGLRRPSWGLTLLAGLGGGLALAIKPHFVLVLGLAHLALLARPVLRQAAGAPLSMKLKAALRMAWRRGRLIPPEGLIAGLLLILYIALVIRLFPAFLDVIYPRVALVYLPHRLTILEFSFAPSTLLWLGIATLVVMLKPRLPGAWPTVLAASAVGAFLAYGVQAKGWAYHLLPAATLGMLALAALVLGDRTVRERPRFRAALAAMAVMAGVLAPALFGLHDKPRALEAEIRRHGERPSVLIASSNLGMSFPLVRRAGADWAGRSASLWMSEGAAALLTDDPPPHRREALKQLYRLDRALFAEDALAARPDIIALSAIDADSDLLPWLLQEPAMPALIAGYTQTAHVDGMRVLVRNDVLARQGARTLAAR